jgi:hypothetical protein
MKIKGFGCSLEYNDCDEYCQLNNNVMNPFNSYLPVDKEKLASFAD